MSASRRLAGGLIDRGRALSFRFDGKAYAGFDGDTLASALLANGVSLFGRSFKYHRPRGVLAAGSEEPNALVELGVGARLEPNTKATTVKLFDGLVAASQNRWPSLRFDLHALNGLLSPVIGAGFYYKTFMWPAPFWERVYEPLIRRSAGFGRLSGEPDPDAYEKANAFCDVLVIGGGPAGLMAALAAGRSGARVVLCDEDFRLGGRLLGETHEVGGTPGAEWAAGIEDELRGLANVRVLRQATVFGVYDGGTYGVLETRADHRAPGEARGARQRLWRIVAGRSVLASGAIERPIAFGGNDVPGVMLASAMRTYVNRFAAAPGERVAVFTTSDDGWRTAADLARAGVQVSAVIDARREVDAGVRASAGATATMLGARVVEAAGGKRLRSILVAGADGAPRTIEADALAVSNGWNPQIGLTSHLGGRPAWDADLGAFLAETPPPGMVVAGAAAGRFTLADALRTGAQAGVAAAAATGHAASLPDIPCADEEPARCDPIWDVAKSRRKAFIDLQNDVTAEDVALAAREGFRSVEHLKRYTTLGMATDQGKTANVGGLALLAALTGRGIPQTGTTLTRPPHVPVAIGAFAGAHRGRHFKPTRLTAAHGWAAEQGASFVESGAWLRAQWFERPGETDWLESVSREVTAARTAVGICDVSTLGKIDIQGADAGAFLDRVYANTFSTLPVGKARYGLMLREDGLVFDDGTTARLGATHFVMSTTTANAGRVMEQLEFCRQVIWPQLDVQMVSVTEQWAQFAVAGPHSRALLQTLFGDALDLSNAALPYMGVAETRFEGVPLRVFRLSFSGELAYEVAVPARHADALARRLMQAGDGLGVTPYGVEALSVMRIEKGHVAGNEINGQTTAADLGLGRMVSAKKDCVGRVMAARPGLADPDRPTLVGFKPVDRAARLRSGAHFLGLGAQAVAGNDEGYMTSVAYSPSLGHWIGLGLLRGGPSRIGGRVRAFDPIRDGDVEVEICGPVFIDPEGARLRV